MAKILVVDDIPDNVKLLAYDLEDDGYEVLTAYNGKSALQMARERLPDVILLDIMMPEMDGIAVLKELKTDKPLQAIPVILVSAKGDEEDVIEGLDAGAHDYVSKPFSYPIVSARVRSAARLKAAHDLIHKKNAELDEFTHIASHDLKTPLRKIVSFIELLENDFDQDLPEKAKQYFQYISNSARQMNSLVQHLLEFSRLGKSALRMEAVPLQQCVDRALSALSQCIGDAKAEIVCDELPIVNGNMTMLTQLFQNLIGNALKFIPPETSPLIHITAEFERSRHGILSVTDNGIGIDPKFAETVFSPFRRLHSRKNYEGSGIGLSICRKVVELHGGNIWVESQPGKGARFKFNLALAETK